MSAPPPPVLMDELIEEILLFLPPDDPASLVRAALVCKGWCHIVSDPRFGRRFRELHRTPSLLGVFRNIVSGEHDIARFVPTSPCPPRADHSSSRALDVRHGRVLLHNTHALPGFLAVWEPITDRHQDLPLPPHHLQQQQYCVAWNAAVLCAAVAAGGTCNCNHLDCHGGPFHVVFLCVTRAAAACFWVYSSETASWSSNGCWILLDSSIHSRDAVGHSLLIGDALHFPVGLEIITYHLGTNRPSLMYSPLRCVRNMCLVATTTDDGGLGLGVAVVKDDTIRLWSYLYGLAAWKEGGVIRLQDMDEDEVRVIGFAEGVDAIFVCAKGCVFMVQLKSQFPPQQPVKVCEIGPHFSSILPYASFYIPGTTSLSYGPIHEIMDVSN